MKQLYTQYSTLLINRKFLITTGIALGMLVASMIINFYATLYATERASSSVTDIFLSNIRIFDVDGLFVYGPLFFWFFIIIVLAIKPHKIPFTLKTISLFVVIRSIFISLTHLGAFPTQMAVHAKNIISQFSTGNDFFFSAHTGLPFLMALLFWNMRPVRYICLASSVFFGIVVLLGHYHYSIDVLSAFFITYSIHHIAQTFFKKDYHASSM